MVKNFLVYQDTFRLTLMHDQAHNATVVKVPVKYTLNTLHRNFYFRSDMDVCPVGEVLAVDVLERKPNKATRLRPKFVIVLKLGDFVKAYFRNTSVTVTDDPLVFFM